MWGLLLRSSTSRASSSTPSSDEYAETLDQLFRAVKNPSRHSDSSNPDELFARRKEFFKKVYFDEAKLSSSVTVVHVAGTKGKGSTVEYVAAGLRTQGHKVGVFTSPHLHTARERIKIGKQLISRSDLTRLGKSALASMHNFSWTVFFDLLLTTALRYFGEQKVDYLVLETGIGGRYDSTNFLDAVSIGVITSISLDHQAMLGETIEEIAWQKAGIIKPGMHVFTPATQHPAVLRVLLEQSKAAGATLHQVPIDGKALAKEGLLLTSTLSLSSSTGCVGAEVPWQIQNACVSMAVLQHLRMPAAGMATSFWPCRMETFSVPPSKQFPGSSSSVTLVLDGCHNGDSVNQFLTGLRARYPQRRICVVFGAGAEKCVDDMMRSLQQQFAASKGASQKMRLVLVQSGHFRSMTEAELADAVAKSAGSGSLMAQLSLPATESKHRAQRAASVWDRLDWTVGGAAMGKGTGDSEVVAVCGSLFVAAEAREWLLSKHPGLFAADDWVRQPDGSP